MSPGADTRGNDASSPQPPPPPDGGTGPTGVALPNPPTSYAVPSGTMVSNAKELSGALTDGTRGNVILANGTYAIGCLTNSDGDNIYAQNVGQAVLTGGIEEGSNSAADVTIQGVAIDITDSSDTCQGAAIDVWGSRVLHVLDTTITGHRAQGTQTVANGTFTGMVSSIDIGVLVPGYAGADLERLVMTSFNTHAIRLWYNDNVPYGTAIHGADKVWDIKATDVHGAQPGGDDGRTEQALFVGEPVTNGVQRIQVSESFIGIQSVNNSYDTTFSDLTVDSPTDFQPSSAVYLEHFTEHDTFTRFYLTHTTHGFNCEWDDGTTGNAACHFDTITNGTISAAGTSGSSYGIFLDQGTESVSISGVTFVGQTTAAIGEQRILSEGTISGNSYSQLAAGAKTVSSL